MDLEPQNRLNEGSLGANKYKICIQQYRENGLWNKNYHGNGIGTRATHRYYSIL